MVCEGVQRLLAEFIVELSVVPVTQKTIQLRQDVQRCSIKIAIGEFKIKRKML